MTATSTSTVNKNSKIKLPFDSIDEARSTAKSLVVKLHDHPNPVRFARSMISVDEATRTVKAPKWLADSAIKEAHMTDEERKEEHKKWRREKLHVRAPSWNADGSLGKSYGYDVKLVKNGEATGDGFRVFIPIKLVEVRGSNGFVERFVIYDKLFQAMKDNDEDLFDGFVAGDLVEQGYEVHGLTVKPLSMKDAKTFRPLPDQDGGASEHPDA